MVTLVPPDSGPLLGDRPVTVGVCQTEMGGKGEVKGGCERQIEGRERMQKEQHLCCASSCIFTDPRQITVIHTAVPMAAECIAGG